MLSGHRMQIGLSIGIGLAPLHAEDAEELLLRADLALLEAKKIGQDNSLKLEQARQDARRMAALRARIEDIGAVQRAPPLPRPGAELALRQALPR